MGWQSESGHNADHGRLAADAATVHSQLADYMSFGVHVAYTHWHVSRDVQLQPQATNNDVEITCK